MAESSRSPHRSLYKQVGSPPWKEAFRQRCLERMRSSRHRLLNKYRQAACATPRSASDGFLVQEVMEEEWNSLQSEESYPEALVQLGLPVDLALLQDIEQELCDEEQSIISEYEKSLQFDENCFNSMLAEWEAAPLICPVCIKYNLRIVNSVVTCPCGLHIPLHSPELTEQKLRACLEDNVNEHSAYCSHTPEFSVTGGTEEKPSLLMSCLGGNMIYTDLEPATWTRLASNSICASPVLGINGLHQVLLNVRFRPSTGEDGRQACDTWAVIL